MNYAKRIQKLKDAAAREREMRRLRKRGWTLERIAKRYGLTRARVCQITGASQP
jgi:DNA-directed RNA polymerase sigma subunit (sigma70/sigma32)